MSANINLSSIVRVPFIFILVSIIFIFSSINVNAQGNSGGGNGGGGFNGGGSGNIPCRDSTPICPCVLPNGDCFDIDTPIDDELKLLVVAGIILGIYKLRKRVKLEVNILP
jgi:hypothetical protein